MGRAQSQANAAGAALRGAGAQAAELSDDAFAGVLGFRRGLNAGHDEPARYHRYGPNGTPVSRLIQAARGLSDAQLRAFVDHPAPDAALLGARSLLDDAHGAYLDAFYADLDAIVPLQDRTDGGPYGGGAWALNRAALALLLAHKLSREELQVLSAGASRLLGEDVSRWR